MRDEFGRKIIEEFVGLRAKTYSYLIDDGSEDDKAKGTQKWVIKRKLKFGSYKTCLEATQLESKINHLEKNKFGLDSLNPIQDGYFRAAHGFGGGGRGLGVGGARRHSP